MTVEDMRQIASIFGDYVDHHENDNKVGTSWHEAHYITMHVMHCVGEAFHEAADKLAKEEAYEAAVEGLDLDTDEETSDE